MLNLYMHVLIYTALKYRTLEVFKYQLLLLTEDSKMLSTFLDLKLIHLLSIVQGQMLLLQRTYNLSYIL